MCAAAVVGAASFAFASAASPSAAILTVSTTADVVNGDVSSPAALIASPGADGISLREAITAADHAVGREAITFAPSIVGQTITPATSLPALTHDDTALVGLTSADGQPAITLDAGGSTSGCCGGLLFVYASGVTISHLRVVGVRSDKAAIVVHAGESNGELKIRGVRVESNVLDNGGGFGVGVWIGTDFPGYVNGVKYPGATEASVSDVTIAHNVIRGYTDDGINVALPGTRCSIENLLIEDNTFADNTGASNPALEIGTIFSDNRIAGTRIVRNTFTGNRVGLYIDGGLASVNQGDGSVMPASGNTVTDTVITQNVFSGNQNALQIVGGLGSSNATGNSVLNTEISNNVVAHSSSASDNALYVFGGESGASGNRVDGIRIVNDTFAFNGGGFWIDDGGLGNQITNFAVENTIFWMNGIKADIGGPSAKVASTTSSSLMGVDPRFVSAQDLHLQAGSPAVDAGTVGAPLVDFEDRVRVGVPDIGAYEFGAAPRPRLDALLEELGGTGTVTSSPAGIACRTTCEAAFNNNTTVTLTATPAAESLFGGWSGPCSGTGVCTLTLAAAATVTATFSAPATATPPPPTPTTPPPPRTVTVTVAVNGKGRVNGGDISCPKKCKTTITSGAKLTLRASAARGYRFAGWSRPCTGLKACTLHPKTAVKITATFRKP